jgi:hypothetical protein
VVSGIAGERGRRDDRGMPKSAVLLARRWRALRVAAALALLAFPLSGCLSIRSEGASQRAAGVVTLGGVVCGSDYNRDTYADCDGDATDGTGPANVAEPDNRAHSGCDADGGATDTAHGCPGLTGTGQLLVGFRVPVGSEGPDGFFTDAHDLHLDKNPSYAQQLQARFPAPADQHWVGYVSTVRTFASGPAADSPTGIHPEFTLPSGPGGAPFAVPYRWRWVVGFRSIDQSQALSAVNCSALSTFCVDSPPQERVSSDLPAENVSDFGVTSAGNATAPQTRTGTLSFALRFADARNLGARDFTLAASTTVPGASATPSAASVHAAPNSTTAVTVAVPVPLGTPAGTYAVTLTASTGSPAVTRASTATLVVGPPPDTDGDGIADPSDKCPATLRGGFDADRDGCVGPYARIASVPTGGWSVSDAGLRIGSMRLPSLPVGARVVLACKVCHVTRTLTAKQSTLELAPLRNKLLRRRQGFTVTATAPGFIGERVTLTVKRFGHSHRDFVRAARRPFTKEQRCIPAGGTAPAKTCSPIPPSGP